MQADPHQRTSANAHTKDAGDLRVFWQGPTIGVDLGADGARTMMLVYNLPRTNAIYQQFNGHRWRRNVPFPRTALLGEVDAPPRAPQNR
jgi:hypothetical protein